MTKEGQANAVQVGVALRIRPLTDRDRAQPRFGNLANDQVLKPQDKTVQVVSQKKHFVFDHVFGTESTQEQVFSQIGDSLVRKFMDGHNATILAYGQTSSGKTYTMGTSSLNEQGIIPLSMSLLFDLLQHTPNMKLKSSKSSTRLSFLSQPYYNRPKYTLHVSFIELYNEELYDLLDSSSLEESPQITIQEDGKGNIHWTGVKQVQVQNTQDVLNCLEQGTQNRATGVTDINEKSSSSHAIFSITLCQERQRRPTSSLGNRSKLEEGENTTVTSKFHFVDLAGSGRVKWLKDTWAEGDRRKEGIHINTGLLALGNVISSLANDKQHISYRDSKLTRLLQDSLGGNATTWMIACVSPAECHLQETLNTLQYASRARSIRNRSERNAVLEEWVTTEDIELLRSIVAKAKEDCDETDLRVADLQRQIEELTDQATVTQERNRRIEEELQRLRRFKTLVGEGARLQRRVQPVVKENEKDITSLKSQLVHVLSQSETEGLVSALKSKEAIIDDLKLNLVNALEREQNNDSYILKLETKLSESAAESAKDQMDLNVLKSRIMKLKESDERTEQYISGLEQRLDAGEKDRLECQQHIQNLEGKIGVREHANVELLKKLASYNTPDHATVLERLDQANAKLDSVEKERDALRKEVKQLQLMNPQTVDIKETTNSSQSGEGLPNEQMTNYTTLADEKETQSSVTAFALAQAQMQLKDELERNCYLQTTLDQLQANHRDTLHKLDDMFEKYQHALDQSDFIGPSHSSSTTHEEDTMLDLSREMSITRDMQKYAVQIEKLQEKLELEEKENESVQQEKRTLEALERQAKDDLEGMRELLERSNASLQACQVRLAESFALNEALEATNKDLLKSQDAMNDEWKQKVDATEAAGDETKKSLEHRYMARCKELESKVAALEEKAPSSAQLKDTISSLESSLNALQSEKQLILAQRDGKIQSQTEKIKALEQQLALVLESRKVSSDWPENVNDECKECAELKKQINRLTLENKRLKDGQKEDEEIQAEMDKECHRLRRELQITQQETSRDMEILKSRLDEVRQTSQGRLDGVRPKHDLVHKTISTSQIGNKVKEDQRENGMPEDWRMKEAVEGQAQSEQETERTVLERIRDRLGSRLDDEELVEYIYDLRIRFESSQDKTGDRSSIGKNRPSEGRETSDDVIIREYKEKLKKAERINMRLEKQLEGLLKKKRFRCL